MCCGGLLLLLVVVGLGFILSRGLAAQRHEAPAVRASPPTPTVTAWGDLVPADWNPLARFRQTEMSSLRDTDPRAARLLQEMQQAWANAPTNAQLDGQWAALDGYVVPLDISQGRVTEFLLVPYFGACIHAPPPPANQVVHVRTSSPPEAWRSMDAVSVSGWLRVDRERTVMGMSGYAMSDAMVVRQGPTH